MGIGIKCIISALTAALVALALMLSPVSGASAVTALAVQAYPLNPGDTSIVKALDYLRDQQQSFNQQQSFKLDGRIAGFNVSGWAVMAIEAAGEDPHAWVAGGKSIVDYLREKASAAISPDKATDYERMLLAIVAAGENPRYFGGINFVDALLRFYDGAQIGGASLLNDDYWGILALTSIGESQEIIQKVKQFLISNRNADGGWGLGTGLESDADNTAAAISALIAAGEPTSSPIIVNALNYLKTQQEDNGGFVSVDGGANAGSTTWAINAIAAAGQNPLAPEWTRNGNNPVSFLLSLQNANGSFKQTPTQTMNPEWMTSYAIPALLGKPYPRDASPPTISNITPTPGSTLSAPGLTISATYSDAVSDINQAVTGISLDGADVTHLAAVTGSGVSYTASSLSAGAHSVVVTVRDKCGNEARKEWSFQVQTPSGGGGGALPLALPESPPPAINTPPPGTTRVSAVVMDNGAFKETISVQSTDKKCKLEIEKDTVGLTADKGALEQISIVEIKKPSAPPEDRPVIGIMYDLGPDGATFEPPVSLTFTYEESTIPEGLDEEELIIGFYDLEAEEWVELESNVEPENNTVTARVSHFCAFAVMAQARPDVAVSELSISPAEIGLNENVSVSVLLTNNSRHSVNHELSLVMDKTIVKVKELTLAAGESQTVTFTLTGYVEGRHEFEIEGLRGEFEVKAKPSAPVVASEPPLPYSDGKAETDAVAIAASTSENKGTVEKETISTLATPPSPARESDTDVGVITGIVVAIILGGITGFLLLRRMRF